MDLFYNKIQLQLIFLIALKMLQLLLQILLKQPVIPHNLPLEEAVKTVKISIVRPVILILLHNKSFVCPVTLHLYLITILNAFPHSVKMAPILMATTVNYAHSPTVRFVNQFYKINLYLSVQPATHHLF